MCILHRTFVVFQSCILLVGALPLIVPRTTPHSPCPDIFWYERMKSDTDIDMPWKGIIRVKAPEEGLPILLKVKLSLKAVLPAKYVGKIKLKEKKDRVINGILHGELNHVIYDVIFPLVAPLPRLTSIHMNGKLLCSSAPVSGRVITTINLEHFLYPVLDTVRLMAGDFGELTPQETELSCGQPLIRNPLVMNGDQVSRGSWPWIVPVFVSTAIGIQFHCSGVLISKIHVLTVAHCMEEKVNKPLKKSSLIFFVGKYNLQNWTEDSTQARYADTIQVHPSFNSNTLWNDIAVIKLNQPVEYSTFVRPVCLWDEDDDLDLVVHKYGTVVGWGMDENGNKVSSKPKMARIPIVSQETCIKSHRDMKFLTSNLTFCAGRRDGTGPCNGDSGAGLVLPLEVDGGVKWTLRGIVSLSLFDRNVRKCDLQNYIVFTDVAKHAKWIEDTLNSI